LALAASEYLETIKNIPIPSRPTLRNSTVVAVVSLGRWGSAETKNASKESSLPVGVAYRPMSVPRRHWPAFRNGKDAPMGG